MTVYVFPGQGSQVKGMGVTLFSEFPEIVNKANEILGYSIKNLCEEDPNDELNSTQYTQPALYVVNALSYLKKVKEGNPSPSYVAGHSLGEYNALLAANVFDFETGLKLVQKRGKLMSEAMGGGMAAVVGLKNDQVEKILKENNLSNISIANYNSYTQLVISGPKEDIKLSQPFFEKGGAMLFIPLNVSGAFHSRYMEPAKQQFAEFLANFTFSTPSIPVIANVNALPYEASKIREGLIEQISHPVLWTQSVEYMIKQGEDAFEELGSGKVLMGLIRRIMQGQ